MTDQLSADTFAAIEEFNRTAWSRSAPTYAGNFGELTSTAAESLLDAAGVGRQTEVVDIGTGPGTVIGPALARGARVTAVDLTQSMIDQAQRRFPDVDCRVANATDLPFPDASFDAATLGFSLHHMADPAGALGEAFRVLRPGGRVACTVWGPMERLEAFAVAFAALEGLAVDLGAGAPETPLADAQPATYLDLLEAAGFAQAAVRELAVTWRIDDASRMVDGFERYVGLQAQPDDVRARFATAVGAAVAARADQSGTALIPNPALLATARRPA